jgi:3-methylcrotonyl-CoA carboxylase alpha subunit
MGIRTVAVYSEADANARHVRLADEAVCIGPAAARESYLVADKISMPPAHRRAGRPSRLRLPLRERRFADACAAAGITFIGPPASAIRAMGSKSAAKTLMAAAGAADTGLPRGRSATGVPAPAGRRHRLPGADQGGAGGGGKGMRLVEKSEDFAAGLASCKREAISSASAPIRC